MGDPLHCGRCHGWFEDVHALETHPCPAPGDRPASPTYWPGQADRAEVGPIGDGTPHARMKWFWERMRQHEGLVGELTGYSVFRSDYPFEAAIADAFDKLATERRDDA